MKTKMISFLLLMQITNVLSQGLIIGAVAAMQSTSRLKLPKTQVLDKYVLFQTINKYDLKNKVVNYKFLDLRDSLSLKKLNCSDIELKNDYKFNASLGASVVETYLDSLLVRSKLIIDKNNTMDLITAKLQVLDSKKTGFFMPKIYGLCQINFNYKKLDKTYCVAIKDGDPNTPVGRTTVIDIDFGRELMVLASIRDVIELFLKDLESYQE